MTEEELKAWNFKIGDLNKISLVDGIDIRNKKFKSGLKKIIINKVSKENKKFVDDEFLNKIIGMIEKEFPKKIVADIKKGIIKEKFDDESENLNFAINFIEGVVFFEGEDQKGYNEEINNLTIIADEYIITNVFKLYLALLRTAKNLDENSQYFVLSNTSDISVFIDLATIDFKEVINNLDYNKIIEKQNNETKL